MLIGYARIATSHQTSELEKQQATLRRAGCTQLFHDIDQEAGTSYALPRSGLSACLRTATSGVSIVVCSLDRLGYRSDVLAATIATLGERSAGLRSLAEEIDTLAQNAGSWPLLGFCHYLRDMEEVLAQERHAKKQATPRKERRGGRKPALDAQQAVQARDMHRNQGMTVAKVCQALGISRTTFYRSLNRATVNE